jgi:hypothetical protein
LARPQHSHVCGLTIVISDTVDQAAQQRITRRISEVSEIFWRSDPRFEGVKKEFNHI